MNYYYTSIIIIILLALTVLSILISENNRLPKMKKKIFIATNFLIALAAIVEYVGVLIGGNANIPEGVLAAVKNSYGQNVELCILRLHFCIFIILNFLSFGWMKNLQNSRSSYPMTR